MYRVASSIPLPRSCTVLILMAITVSSIDAGWNTSRESRNAPGLGWTAFIHPEDLPELLKKWGESRASGQIFECEARVRRADGQYLWFLHRNLPLRDEHGSIVMWYGAGTEIDDRKRAEEELKKAFDEIKAIAAYWLGVDIGKGHVGVPAVARLLCVGVVARLKIVHDKVQLLLAGRGDVYFITFLSESLVQVHHLQRFGCIARQDQDFGVGMEHLLLYSR